MQTIIRKNQLPKSKHPRGRFIGKSVGPMQLDIQLKEFEPNRRKNCISTRIRASTEVKKKLKRKHSKEYRMVIVLIRTREIASCHS